MAGHISVMFGRSWTNVHECLGQSDIWISLSLESCGSKRAGIIIISLALDSFHER